MKDWTGKRKRLSNESSSERGEERKRKSFKGQDPRRAATRLSKTSQVLGAGINGLKGFALV